VTIVSFSLGILVPRFMLGAAVSAGASFSLLLCWARSGPASDVIGRVVHSRRFEELRRCWWGCYVDLVDDLLAGRRWWRACGSSCCGINIAVFFRFRFSYGFGFDLVNVGWGFADEFPSAFGAAGFGSFSFVRRGARPEARYRRKPFRGGVVMFWFCGVQPSGRRRAGAVVWGKLEGRISACQVSQPTAR
jgi:hypothetical protein